MKIENLIKEKACTIVDVRSHEEFMGGHVADSINIPLGEIQQRMQEIENLKQPLILCCASGNRSGQAQQYLSQKGIHCHNGGSWLDVNYYQSQTS
ncbi:Rhodanese-like domain-containing protein [Flavobacterium micromati]|uniref:Rhodanese-like domain-containing protein n=2 Tax=Flavobacterium micromati TaxID=229205 RepID=A0A1M5GKK5_9FLAO|nr:rhodanese-like domain-containing protein [Flavobacterium micromati]SHG04285.1 Rhodanese-like domain-containing protein [Flavobacterium micromati]